MEETQKTHIEPGIYRNRKTGNLYFFTGEISKHSETLEDMVEYYSLKGDGQKWSRPLSIFLEEKEQGNPQSTRFKFLTSVPKSWRGSFQKQKFVSRNVICRISSFEYDDTWNGEENKIRVKVHTHDGISEKPNEYSFFDFTRFFAILN